MSSLTRSKVENKLKDNWMMCESDDSDHESTFFCSEYKKTPVVGEEPNVKRTPYNLRPRKTKDLNAKLVKAPEQTLNLIETHNQFGDSLKLNVIPQSGDMN